MLYEITLTLMSAFVAAIFVWPILAGNKKYKRTTLSNGDLISKDDLTLLEEAAMSGDVEALYVVDEVQTEIFAGKMTQEAAVEGGWEPMNTAQDWHEYINPVLGCLMFGAIAMLYIPVNAFMPPLAYLIVALAGLRLFWIAKSIVLGKMDGGSVSFIYVFIASVYVVPLFLATSLL